MKLFSCACVDVQPVAHNNNDRDGWWVRTQSRAMVNVLVALQFPNKAGE